MSDYMPTKDADLIAWMNVFMTYAGTNMTALGLVAADMTLQNPQIAAERALPPVKRHCSVLAEEAIKAAVADLKKKQTAP